MEQQNPAISVIIPMYNVERYIIYCMESILQQTFRDFEVILIDDASTDRTYRVCQSLFGNDERVRMLHNPVNQGQCNSRNRGIKEARGKYLYFMDSDDEILPQGLEKLYSAAEAEEADVVHTNFYTMVYSSGRMRLRKSLWRGTRSHDTAEGILQGTLEERFRYQGMKSLPMPWLNLYRREFLLEERLFFPDLAISEDDMFSMAVILKARRFVRINEVFYLYRQHFHERERVVARLPKAFALMEKALATAEGIFGRYSEEELSFALREDFKAGWVRAHLKTWLLDVLNTREKADMKEIKNLLSSVAPSHRLLLSTFVYMLDNDTGMRERLAREWEKDRKDNGEVFSEFDRGTTQMKDDYVWLYAQSRLAALVKGGDTAYYREAYRHWAKAAFRLGRYQEALEAYQRAVEHAESYSPELLRIFDEYLCALHFQEFSADDIAKVHNIYGQQLGNIVPYRHGKREKEKRRIRIGYISPFFYDHELFEAYYGMLFAYDKENFEVYCYYAGRIEDNHTKAIKEKVDKFLHIADLEPKEAAEAIHDDDIDALVDLAGHLPGNSLQVLAYKPAPVQISGVGYPSTTGLGAVDYYLTDEVIDPPAEGDALFVEKLLYLPCRFSFGRLEEIPMPSELPCLRRGYVTLGIFAPYYQLADDMLYLWQEIMKSLPKARLMVWSEDFACGAMIAEATDRFMDMGFDMGHVRFETGTAWEGYRSVDMMLDTYPQPGGMRMLRSLYMGVPVVSLYGERRDTRVGLSILRRLGMEELAAGSRAEYLRKVLALAKEPKALSDLHCRLRMLLKDAQGLQPEYQARCLEDIMQKLILEGKL